MASARLSSQLFSLGVKWPFQYFDRLSQKIAGRNTVASNRNIIVTNSLFAKLEIDPLDTYYNRRLLRWPGHVSRMPMSRVPRKLLTSWVAKPRPVGSP